MAVTVGLVVFSDATFGSVARVNPTKPMTSKKISDPMVSSLFIEPSDYTGGPRIGTSGWSYPPNTGPGSWTGIFYPMSKTDELRFYSRFFNAVEVNSTFYRPCTAKTAE